MTNSNIADSYDYLIKLIVIGDSAVGKSSILTRYTRNQFNHDTKSTIGVEFASANLTIQNKRVKATIWDTAGQDRFRAATNSYYRGSLGAFIVYDITNLSSFQNVPKWLAELREHVSSDIVITLVGNKLDLRHLRAVPSDDAAHFAKMNNLNFIETSALDSSNIQLAFKSILTEIYQILTKAEENENKTNRAENDSNSKIVDIKISNEPKQYECCRTN